MLDRPAAQALIDGFAAVTLAVTIWGLAPWSSASPIRARLAFAFGALCLFFAGRSASLALDSDALSTLTEVVACLLPIAALIVAEGLLRRHAPTILKALICAAALGAAVAIVATDGRPPAAGWGLGTYVVLSLAAVTALLVGRDRSSLSRQENASVEAVIACAAAMVLLSVTDFLPAAPSGLSGVGAAMVAYAVSANPSSGREARLALSHLAVICVLATAATLPLSATLGMSGAEEARLGAIVLAALLATGAVVDARRRAGRSTRAFALALAAADTRSVEGFLGSLADQPLLAGLRLAEGGLLTDYDQPALAAAMVARPVWTAAALHEGHEPVGARARDELGDLMARTESTHALLISPEPLRIALLTLPGAGPTEDVAADLALFGKLAALAAEDNP